MINKTVWLKGNVLVIMDIFFYNILIKPFSNILFELNKLMMTSYNIFKNIFVVQF